MAKRSVSADINRPVSVTVTGGGVAATGGGGGGTLPGTITPTTGNTVTGNHHTHRMLPTHAALPDIGPDDHHAPVTVGNTGLSIAGQQVSLRLATVSGLEISSGLRLADSIAGAGLGIASKVLSVALATNSGLQLSGSPAKLHLRAPSSLDATTANTVTDVLGHTHAVVAYSDLATYPGQLAKADASGDSTWHRVDLTDRLRAPLIDSAAGQGLTIAPDEDLSLSPVSGVVKATSGVAVGTDNFVSQTTGWRAAYDGGADFRYLYADELHAKSFITDLEQALAGGQIISKSVAVIAVDFTVPAAGAAGTLVVEDLPGANGQAVFQDGDMVRLRQFTRGSGSLSIANCWGVVEGYTDNGDGTQSWTFTRSSGTRAGTATAGSTIPARSLALDYGTSGNGFYEVNAIDGVWAQNSPYAQVVTWATHPADGQVVRSRWGNLRGIFAAGDDYGLYAAVDGHTDADQYLRISSLGATLHNLPLELYRSGAKVLALDPAAPSLALGNPIPTGWLTQDGFWAGRHTDGSYRQYVGEVSGGALVRGMSWDGSAAWFKGTVFIEDGSEFGAGNLMWDSSFELGKNSYTATRCEVARPTTNPDGYASPVSTRMLRLSNFGAYPYGDAYAYIDQDIPVAAGQQITVSFWATKGGTITSNSSYIRWSDGSHTLLGPSNLWTLVGTSANWTRHYYTFTVPAGITSMRLRFGTINTNQWWVCVDHIMVSYGDVPMAWAPGLWGGVIVDGASVLVGTPGGQRVELSADGLQGLTASDEYSFLLANDDIASWGGFSSLAAGDVVLGHNKAGSSAFFWDKSAGKGGFYGDGGATPQVEIDTDGSIVAGAGNITLDTGGITIDASTSYEASRTYKITGPDSYYGRLYGRYNVSGASNMYLMMQARTTDRAANIYVDSTAVAAGDDSNVIISASKAGGASATLTISMPSTNVPSLSFNGGLNVGTATGAAAGEIFTSGDVGIGTSSPQSRLNVMVAGTNVVPVYIESSDYFASAGGKIALEFRTLDTRGTAARNARIGMTNLQVWTQSPALYFEAGNTEIMRLLSAGRVLIGTTVDDGVNHLQVNGSVKAVYTVTSWLDILDGVAAPATVAGWARIYVDTADGDLKIKFGNGTVKTIVTD